MVRMRKFALVLCAALVISACSGAQGNLAGDPPGPSELSSGNGFTKDTDKPETLNEYFDTFTFTMDPQELADNVAIRLRRNEEIKVACMKREGFEYIPYEPAVQTDISSMPGNVDDAHRFGFEISTRFGEIASFLIEEERTNPNKEIVESLSEAELDAYYTALQGFPRIRRNENGELENAEYLDRDFGGCYGEIAAEALPSSSAQDLFEALDIESMFARMDSSPRKRDIETEWSNCMAEKGYVYQSPDALQGSVRKYFHGKLSKIDGFSRGDETWTRRDRNTDIDQVALAALQAEERALAVAYAECAVNYHKQLNVIFRDFEKALISENQALLDLYYKLQRL